MEQPKRIQLSRKKGWRMPPNTVKVDRSSRWGNPFIVGVNGTADVVLDKYIRFLIAYAIVAPQDFSEYIDLLRGKNLACWCKIGEPCHADILLEIANEKTE